MMPDGEAQQIIIQYWHTDPPPPVVELTASFERNNQDFAHLLFNEETADDFIARYFSSRQVDAFRTCAVAAMQADYFRYCAVFVLGGIYADADWRCVGALHPLLERAGDGLIFGRREIPDPLKPFAAGMGLVDGYRVVANKLFAFSRPEHPFLELAVEIATVNIEQRAVDGAAGVWLTTGPGVFTSLYLHHRLGANAFLEHCSGTVLEPTAPAMCATLEDRDDLVRRLDRLAVDDIDEVDPWLQPLTIPAEHCSPHWGTPAGSIFRET